MLPLAQVGIRKPPDERWTWILERNLNDAAVEPFRGPGLEFRIVGPDDPALLRLQALLAQLGITFRQQGRIDQPMPDESGQLPFLIESTVDSVIRRGVAKIAFNYLAYCEGAQFVQGADFEPIRRFIRYGERLNWQAVAPTQQPILLGDTLMKKQTRGHLIVVQWDRTKSRIVGRVSLFNEITYQVVLCSRYADVWREVASGHVFDIEDRTISRLGHTRLCLPRLSA
jgi:hypothetical protein